MQKGLQLSFDQPESNRVISMEFGDQSECKNGYPSEVLTNLGAKGLVQWSFDQAKCIRVISMKF